MTKLSLTDDELGCILEALGFACGIYEKQGDVQQAEFIRTLAQRLAEEESTPQD